MDQFRTGNFKRITIGNMLMFTSLYMLFPALPPVMREQLGISFAQVGGMFLMFIAGLLLTSPFLSYLTDVFQRKKLCMFSYAVLLMMIAAYGWVDFFYQLAVLSFVQGVAFCISANAFISISIDVTAPNNRDRGNIVFAGFGRAGVMLGILSGSTIYPNYDFDTLLVLSLATGFAGFLCLMLVRIPFRAPIGSKIMTADRFFLPRCSLPAINMVMIAFVPGLMLPLIHFEVGDTFLSSALVIPYFLIVGAGYFLSYAVIRFLKSGSFRQRATAGLLCVVVAVSVFILFNGVAGKLISALLLGCGLGLALPVTLSMFVGLSQHCERTTANFTWLLAWHTGLLGGMFVACHLSESASPGLTFRIAMIVAAVAFIWFAVVSYPVYRKKG